MKNKRGQSTILEPIIFIVLNIAFIAVLILFVSRSAGGTLVYEQAYAKQLALLIDEAKPGMTISLDMSKAIELAEKKGQRKDKIVGIDDSTKNVFVSLAPNGGYGMKYFSGYRIVVKSGLDKGSNLILGVEENG